jgi:hypothetical protein
VNLFLKINYINIFVILVDTDLIPEELLVPVIFHKLPGPLVSQWNDRLALNNYVITSVKEAIVYPLLISKKDAQVL